MFDLFMDMVLTAVVGLGRVLVFSYVAWFIAMNAWGSHRY